MKRAFDGKVSADGKMTVYDQEGFSRHYQQFKGMGIRITVEKGNKRTSPMNRYYWGVMIKQITKRLKELGTEINGKPVTDDDTHEFLKDKFIEKKVFSVTNPKTGEIEERLLRGSTTDMTTVSMPEEYWQPIQRWCAEFLGINIPDPGQTEWLGDEV